MVFSSIFEQKQKPLSTKNVNLNPIHYIRLILDILRTYTQELKMSLSLACTEYVVLEQVCIPHVVPQKFVFSSNYNVET